MVWGFDRVTHTMVRGKVAYLNQKHVFIILNDDVAILTTL
jgi:hypothetical protein